MPVAFTDADFKEKVTDSQGLVLVDFWAPWCGPCVMLGPIIEEIAEEMGDKVSVGKVNVDENQNTAMEFRVMSIPTVILFKDGQPMQTFVGVQPKQAYVSAIESLQ